MGRKIVDETRIAECDLSGGTADADVMYAKYRSGIPKITGSHLVSRISPPTPGGLVSGTLACGRKPVGGERLSLSAGPSMSPQYVTHHGCVTPISTCLFTIRSTVPDRRTPIRIYCNPWWVLMVVCRSPALFLFPLLKYS